MNELKETVETLIELDEPEVMLETLKRAAQRRQGKDWTKLAQALAYAQDKYFGVEAPASATSDSEAKAE
jgi:hypothetical protein